MIRPAQERRAARRSSSPLTRGGAQAVAATGVICLLLSTISLPLANSRSLQVLSDAVEAPQQPPDLQELLEKQAIGSLRPWTALHAQGQTFDASDVAELYRQVRGPAMRITLVDGQVSVDGPDAAWTKGRAHQVLGMLYHLQKTQSLPDGLDIVWNLDDKAAAPARPLSYHQPPIFSFYSRHGFADVPATEREALSLHSVVSSSKLVQANPWESRNNTAFWRGSPTGGIYTFENWRDMPRTRLVNLSLHQPDFLDAMFTKPAMHQLETGVWDMMRTVLGEPDVTGLPSDSTQAKYKYMVDLDGNAWSSRFLPQLAKGCVTFKVEPSYPTHMTSIVLPYVHYMPVQADLSDLIDQLEYARSHDQEMHAIAVAARELMVELARVWPFHLQAMLQEYVSLFSASINVSSSSLQ